MKRLFADIETSPNVVLSWRLGYKINIDHANLLKERAIICIGYKWQGDKKTEVLTWDAKQCDKKMLAEFRDVLVEADELVGHNIDRFDLPWISTRCIHHGIDPLPPVKTADTLQWARRRLLFNSNRLDYIASFLGIGSKIKTEFDLWKSVFLDHDKKALDKMAHYCAHDVVLLEKVWEKLSKVCPVKSHAGVLAGGEKSSCPRCGSEKVQRRGEQVSAKGGASHRIQCRECAGWFSVAVRKAA